MLLCDKGVRADKRVCVKCFKDELDSDIKVWLEKEGRGWRGGRGGLQLTSVVLQGRLHFLMHTEKCHGKTCWEYRYDIG